MLSIKLSTGCVHYLDQGEGMPLVVLHANPGVNLEFCARI